VPPAGYLAAVGEFCRRHEILVVADEVQTGLGRTGHWFESLAQGLEPDIITLGKHLSGGMAPIGVTIARRELCQRAIGGLGCDRIAGTYSGNSLSTAIALKSLELLVQHDLPARAQALGRRGGERLHEIAAAAPQFVEEVRAAGMLFALQLRPILGANGHRRGQDALDELTTSLGMSALHEGGVEANMALNATRVVRLSPALTIPDDLFDEMWNRVEQTALRNNPSWRLLMHTHARTLLGVADLAHTTTT
jgi:acetylornithine/succinyldiaminopimelate/putrescine aminotransferase